MADISRTVTIATSSTAVTFPSDKGKSHVVKVRNLDSTNGVWVRLKGDGAAAVAEADETEYIGPKETLLVPFMQTCHMIAVGGAVKVNIVQPINRSV